MASGGPGSPGLEYKDYYAVLGVPRAASQAEVKKAFRKLARQHHPDAKPGDTAAERKFKEINEANEVLSDPAKRRQYDQLGANWEPDQPGSRGRSDRRRPVRRVRRRQRPLRVPHRRRRRVLRLLPRLLRRGRRRPTGPARRPVAARPRRAARWASTTSWPGWGSTADAVGGAGADRPRPRLIGGLGPAQARAETHRPRGDRRDHPRRGLPGHDPPRRGRRQAARDHDPEGCRERDPHQADRARTGRRRPHRRGPHAARRPLHPPRRGSRTRPAADASRKPSSERRSRSRPSRAASC